MAKFCSNCGAKLNDEQAICLECGVLINNTNKTNNNVNSNVNKSDKSSLVGFILFRTCFYCCLDYSFIWLSSNYMWYYI